MEDSKARKVIDELPQFALQQLDRDQILEAMLSIERPHETNNLIPPFGAMVRCISVLEDMDLGRVLPEVIARIDGPLKCSGNEAKHWFQVACENPWFSKVAMKYVDMTTFLDGMRQCYQKVTMGPLSHAVLDHFAGDPRMPFMKTWLETFAYDNFDGIKPWFTSFESEHPLKAHVIDAMKRAGCDINALHQIAGVQVFDNENRKYLERFASEEKIGMVGYVDCTALWYTYQMGRADCIKALLAQGADPHAVQLRIKQPFQVDLTLDHQMEIGEARWRRELADDIRDSVAVIDRSGQAHELLNEILSPSATGAKP